MMSRQSLGLRLASTIFGIVAAAHLLRLATRAELVIAGWEVPLRVNALGVLIAGGLCVWLWRLSRLPSARGETTLIGQSASEIAQSRRMKAPAMVPTPAAPFLAASQRQGEGAPQHQHSVLSSSADGSCFFIRCPTAADVPVRGPASSRHRTVSERARPHRPLTTRCRRRLLGDDEGPEQHPGVSGCIVFGWTANK